MGGTLRKRFRQLLEKTHTRKKGGKVFAHSLARYPLSAKPVPRALDAALRVYDLWKKHKKDWTLWQIGEAANVFPDGQTKPTDTPGTIRDKRTAMASTVRRYITTAERYVENVGKGRFPVK